VSQMGKMRGGFSKVLNKNMRLTKRSFHKKVGKET